MANNVKTILCAMSGGVDSSVAALLLKKSGYKVIGVFFNFQDSTGSFDTSKPENKCCSEDSFLRARQTAIQLGIKLYSINLTAKFRDEIINYYLSQYESGLTPNPCIICNKQIKFKTLLELKYKLKADGVATGHYAQIEKHKGGYRLLRGIDPDKDQSYFLWQLNYDDLAGIHFPVGSITKSGVRQIAGRHHLPSSNKKDSQGLCFIGSSNIEYISEHAKVLLHPGNVVDVRGHIIGKHNGLALYTIGQRAGFNITDKSKWRFAGLDTPPLYVSKIIIDKNTLVVTENSGLLSNSCFLNQTNWLIPPDSAPDDIGSIRVQIRYRHFAVPCHLLMRNHRTSVSFKRPQRAVTPGQACAFYKSNQLIGGGFISP